MGIKQVVHLRKDLILYEWLINLVLVGFFLLPILVLRRHLRKKMEVGFSEEKSSSEGLGLGGLPRRIPSAALQADRVSSGKGFPAESMAQPPKSYWKDVRRGDVEKVEIGRKMGERTERAGSLPA